MYYHELCQDELNDIIGGNLTITQKLEITSMVLSSVTVVLAAVMILVMYLKPELKIFSEQVYVEDSIRSFFCVKYFDTLGSNPDKCKFETYSISSNRLFRVARVGTNGFTDIGVNQIHIPKGSTIAFLHYSPSGRERERSEFEAKSETFITANDVRENGYYGELPIYCSYLKPRNFPIARSIIDAGLDRIKKSERTAPWNFETNEDAS